ncbi:MAG: tyrosine-type recombinase/integrase [Candidatus Sulfotelmatobacter sp.]
MPDLLAQFLEHLKAERACSPNTVVSYGFDLRQFCEYESTDPLARSADAIRAFIESRLTSGISPRTARRQLSAIRSFYEFLFLEGAITRNPARTIRAPKAHRGCVRPVNGAEIDKILAALDGTTPLDYRNRAMIFAAYGSGFRVSELLRVGIDDLDFGHSIAKVRLGKGKKDRLVPMNQPEMEAITVWLDKGRPKFLRESDPDNRLLFIGERGDALTRQRIWQVLTEISMKVIGRAASPHKFRHGFVTDSINGGADIRVVQQMAGHASILTTALYFHSSVERIRTEYLKSHPRGGNHATSN